MRKIEDEELKQVNGGISAWVIAGIGVVVTFVAGIIDGIARPKPCHK